MKRILEFFRFLAWRREARRQSRLIINCLHIHRVPVLGTQIRQQPVVRSNDDYSHMFLRW